MEVPSRAVSFAVYVPFLGGFHYALILAASASHLNLVAPLCIVWGVHDAVTV